MGENLPAKRVHETTPPDDPAGLLDYYEAVVTEAIAVSEKEHVRLWLALEEIHKQDLWRLTGSKSFVEYVDERWSIARSTAYRQIAWARAARETAARQLSDPSRARDKPVEGIQSQRQVARTRQEGSRRRPAGAVEATAHDRPAAKGADVVEPTPITEDPDLPEPGPEPDPLTKPEPQQLALFPVTRLLEEAFNNRRDEVLAIEGSKRKQLAKRMRAWADELDPPPPEPPPKPPTSSPLSSDDVTPNFKKAKR